MVLALSTLAGSRAWSQDGHDSFTAYSVPIDATAASALAARQSAIAAGQAAGLQQVLRRLTLQADYGRLPAPSAEQIAAMVISFQVANEKTSNVRYLASLTVDYRKDDVQNLLRAADIPFSESQARPALVLPVFERGEERWLFDEQNLWRSAWGSLPVSEHGLLPLVQPLGDLQDLTSITAETALQADKAAFAGLMERYGATSVVVAQAILQGDPELASSLRLDVTTYRTGAIGDAVLVSSFMAKEGEDFDAFLRRAAQVTASELQENWKERTILRFREQAVLSARVSYGTLGDWIEIRKRLAGIASIAKVDVTSVSVVDAQVVLHYLGAAEPLVAALRASDLQLEQREGFWELRRRDAAVPAPEPAAPVGAAAPRVAE